MAGQSCMEWIPIKKNEQKPASNLQDHLLQLTLPKDLQHLAVY